MKNVIKYIGLVVFLIVSCDPSGSLFLTNGYSFDVFAHMKYEYQGQILEESVKLKPDQNWPMGAFGRDEYNHIISMRIETIDEAVIAEYSAEYLEQIRNAYKQRNTRIESWIFTEKGLFLKSRDIRKKYEFDSNAIIEHYRSDDAVKELEERLKGAQ